MKLQSNGVKPTLRVKTHTLTGVKTTKNGMKTSQGVFKVSGVKELL